MNKEKILVLAYMGTGKTEVEKHYKNVVDFDFQDFKFIYDKSIAHLPIEQRKGNVNLRTENPEYPSNFLNAALTELQLGHIVISPFIEHVFRAYDSDEFKQKAKDVRIILVCPERANFEEYVARFKARGNGEEFIARREKEFSSLTDLFESAQDYERIVMQHGQFLDNALIKHGIQLQPKVKTLEELKNKQ